MSSLWTPEGEHPVDAGGRRAPPNATPPADAPGAPGGSDDLDADPEDEAALAARLDDLRRQLVSTPAEVVVANHAYGLFELAAMHLSRQPPGLEQARLAVDAMGALVEGLGGRLGEAGEPLVAALAQIRLAYVQINGAAQAPVPGESRPEDAGSR